MKNLVVWRVSKVTAVLGAMLVALVASTAMAQSLEEIVDKSLEAQGGRKALTGLKAIERKGDVAVDGAFGQMEGTVEEVVVPGKKAFRALDLTVFMQKDGFNGEVAWRDGMMGIQDLEGDEAAQIKQSIVVNPLLAIGQDGAEAKKLDDETVDDVAYYVIELTLKDSPAVKMYVDKESNLLKRTSLTQNNPQFGEIEVTMSTDDYQEFGPVKLPTKQKITLGEILEIDTTFTETKVNGEIDEAIFDKPEAPAGDAERPTRSYRTKARLVAQERGRVDSLLASSPCPRSCGRFFKSRRAVNSAAPRAARLLFVTAMCRYDTLLTSILRHPLSGAVPDVLPADE